MSPSKNDVANGDDDDDDGVLEGAYIWINISKISVILAVVNTWFSPSSD